jgi:hypothetical protein
LIIPFLDELQQFSGYLYAAQLALTGLWPEVRWVAYTLCHSKPKGLLNQEWVLIADSTNVLSASFFFPFVCPLARSIIFDEYKDDDAQIQIWGPFMHTSSMFYTH